MKLCSICNGEVSCCDYCGADFEEWDLIICMICMNNDDNSLHFCDEYCLEGYLMRLYNYEDAEVVEAGGGNNG